METVEGKIVYGMNAIDAYQMANNTWHPLGKVSRRLMLARGREGRIVRWPLAPSGAFFALGRAGKVDRTRVSAMIWRAGVRAKPSA